MSSPTAPATTPASTTAPAPAPGPQRDPALPEALLWDMDGTLVDTEPYWIACEQELLGGLGVRWTHEHALQLVGSALPEAAAVIRDHVLAEGGPRLDPERIVTDLLAGVVAKVRVAVPWRPGALQLLTAARGAGVRLALVTMSYRSLADVVAALVPGGFDVVVAGDEVERGKPHPDPYLRAAELLGVPAPACVALEDSPTGVRSAEAAGCATVAVPHMVPIEAAPGRSRVPSLEVVDLAVLARLRGGEVVDLLG